MMRTLAVQLGLRKETFLDAKITTVSKLFIISTLNWYIPPVIPRILALFIGISCIQCDKFSLIKKKE